MSTLFKTEDNKTVIYKSRGDKGLYYYITKKGKNRLVTTQEKILQNKDKYEIISYEEAYALKADIKEEMRKGDKLTPELTTDKVEMRVYPQVTFKNIKSVGEKNGLIISTAAVKALQASGKNYLDICNFVLETKEQYPDCNKLQFDTKNNSFNVSYRCPRSSEARSEGQTKQLDIESEAILCQE
jgi:hypothetical protein